MNPKLFKAKGRIATDILGRRKYTNYMQALNEAVANSLDWGSSLVNISLSKDYIEIEDDGLGMSEESLINRYFTLGENNPNKEARGMFGIGICANAALGRILTVETRSRGENKGIKAVVNFDRVEEHDLGNYTAEKWEEINFSGKEYSTLVRIENLKWDGISSEEIMKFLTEKHWPLFLDKDIQIVVKVNGYKLEATEPRDALIYNFRSDHEFRIGERYIPKQELDCGLIKGTFYLKEEGFGEDASIDVYVKNQRIDKYSGEDIDWLKIKDLSSAAGFRSRIKGLIKVEASNEKEYKERSPFDKNILELKSDRSGFFEESIAFKHLCAYLNEKSKGRVLNLPYGGVLRLINSDWYKNRGQDISKTQELIKHFEQDLKKDLSKIFEEEKFNIKQDVNSTLIKQTRKKPEEQPTPKPENIMFRCPKCQDILRVKISIYKKWQRVSEDEKLKLQKQYWICNTCGCILNPDRDKYKKGPISGEEILQIKLTDGSITRILAEAMGKNGIRSVYLPEDSAVRINAEHAMLVYSIKTSDEAFKCYLLDSIIYAISFERSKGREVKDFQLLYNDLSAKIGKVIDVAQYEEALNQLRVSSNYTNKSLSSEWE